jgi:hypothetical protein
MLGFISPLWQIASESQKYSLPRESKQISAGFFSRKGIVKINIVDITPESTQRIKVFINAILRTLLTP